MKFLFVGVFAVVMLAASLAAQTIVISNQAVVTAAAGDARCVFAGPVVVDQGTLTCYAGKTVVLSQRFRPAVDGSLSGQFQFPLHLIAWVLSQPTPDVFTWAITVDGITHTGTF
jgi:lipopolysaccharide export system protein LptA